MSWSCTNCLPLRYYLLHCGTKSKLPNVIVSKISWTSAKESGQKNLTRKLRFKLKMIKDVKLCALPWIRHLFMFIFTLSFCSLSFFRLRTFPHCHCGNTTVCRLRDNIEELRRSFEPKENALETLQQSLLEKEQVRKKSEHFPTTFGSFLISSTVCHFFF